MWVWGFRNRKWYKSLKSGVEDVWLDKNANILALVNEKHQPQAQVLITKALSKQQWPIYCCDACFLNLHLPAAKKDMEKNQASQQAFRCSYFVIAFRGTGLPLPFFLPQNPAKDQALAALAALPPVMGLALVNVWDNLSLDFKIYLSFGFLLARKQNEK